MNSTSQLSDIRTWSIETITQLDQIPEDQLRSALAQSLVNTDKLLQAVEPVPESPEQSEFEATDQSLKANGQPLTESATSEEKTILSIRCLLDEVEVKHSLTLGLLEKLPQFDPSWKAETIHQWQSMFEKLWKDSTKQQIQIRQLKREIKRIHLIANMIAAETFGSEQLRCTGGEQVPCTKGVRNG